MFVSGLGWLLALGSLGLVTGLFLGYLAAHEEVQPQLHADNLKCLSKAWCALECCQVHC